MGGGEERGRKGREKGKNEKRELYSREIHSRYLEFIVGVTVIDNRCNCRIIQMCECIKIINSILIIIKLLKSN